MLEIRLCTGNGYVIVDKMYSIDTEILQMLIMKAKKYVEDGYLSATIYFIYQVNIGDISKDEVLDLFYCNADNEKFKRLNRNSLITIASEFMDLEVLEKAIDVMIRCEGLPEVYKCYKYKRCPSCGLYHHGDIGNCLTCKKLKVLGFKVLKSKEYVSDYLHC